MNTFCYKKHFYIKHQKLLLNQAITPTKYIYTYKFKMSNIYQAWERLNRLLWEEEHFFAELWCL